jgi:hypothetical protein
LVLEVCPLGHIKVARGIQIAGEKRER